MKEINSEIYHNSSQHSPKYDLNQLENQCDDHKEDLVSHDSIERENCSHQFKQQYDQGTEEIGSWLS